MAFDIQGALSSGYSEKEIADYIAKQNKFDVTAARKAGYSDAEIIGHFETTPDQSQMLPSHGPAQPVEGWKQTVSNYAKPVIEGGMMMAGGILGAPAAGPVGSAAGAALGYAGAQQVNKLLDNYLLDTPAETPINAATGAAEDLRTGAMLGMGGELIAPVLGGAYRAVKGAIPRNIPGTQKAVQNQASEIWQNAAQSPAALSEIEARNVQQANELRGRIGADDLNFTPGQASGNFKQNYLEQGRATYSPDFGGELAATDSALASKARTNLTNNLPVAPSITAKSAQQSGEETISAIKSAREPVKAAENEAWSKVNSQYSIESANTSQAFNEINNDIIPPAIKSKVESIYEFYKSVPRTVQGLRAVDAEITQQINIASRAGENNTARILGKIKEGIQSDFAALSDAATTGKLYEYNGSLVNPDILVKEIQSNDEAIKQLSTIGDRLEIKPTKQLEELASRNDRIKEVLAGMRPAEDVAKQIRAAKDATIARAERFDTGVTKNVLRKGQEITGLKTQYEDIPARYFDPSGADDLIRAVGKQEAKRLNIDHVRRGMEKLSTNGVLNIPAAAKYLQTNAQTLGKFGIQKDAEQIIREQIPGYIRSRLDQRLAVDPFMRETNTLTEVRSVIKDVMPTMKRVYGNSSKEITALLDYHKTLQLLGRNKNVSYAKGSNTGDKIFGAFQSAPEGSLFKKMIDGLSEAIIGTGAGFAVGGPVGAAVGGVGGVAAKTARKVLSDHQRAGVEKLLQQAITDPDAAAMLMKIGRGYKPDKKEIQNLFIKSGYYATAPQFTEK